jgi:hydroxyethylthiazole kinase
MENWAAKISALLADLRNQKPLIHNITNLVVMNFSANVLLATGASPIMAHALEEIAEIATFSKALVLNMGTLDDTWIQAMIIAGKSANRALIPVVFDPVGAGATAYRTLSAERIISEVHCSIIRGNASEMLAISGRDFSIQGVDSLQDSDELAAYLKPIARELKTVAAVTGKVDYVSDGDRIVRIEGGDAMFRKVTGSGCALSAVCGAFAAVASSPLEASVSALAFYGMAGEIAAQSSKSPGTFQIAFLDALSSLDSKQIAALTKVVEV